MKTKSELTPWEREYYLQQCVQELLQGQTSEGAILARLRKQILGMSQTDYATLVGLSRRTLSDIENDTGDQSLSVLNAAFKPFGLRMGLLPTHGHVLAGAIKALPEQDTTRAVNYFRR
ncbi:helix-turn-helix domain-containing protein [Cellvibrio japonicus]|nr:helix-turn-helix transcriptional regulator [Cellvibrio japonicus]QEI13897.1 helix-turn-helix transcriptional regulator [Cellvibrio japonicus]QEI17471.1 helix-turn-helix transcriptional regulator [Cellvibrio japonicus]QEI21047.1 helix-turn-helix transcriptional regulator [Cellvibrio japonicus]